MRDAIAVFGPLLAIVVAAFVLTYKPRLPLKRLGDPRPLPGERIREAMLEAQLRHDLNAEAEAIYQGDTPHCPNCQVVFNNDADRSEVLPCADCQPDQLPQRTGRHHRKQVQTEDGTIFASVTDLQGPLDDQSAAVIQEYADKLRRQP